MLKVSKAFLTVAAALMAWGFVAGTAWGEEPESHVLFAHTEVAAVGERAEFVARVVDTAGLPLEGVRVTFVAEMAFLNTFGTVTIGEAVTDMSGVARAFFILRTEGELTVTARAGSVEGGALGETAGTLTVGPGGPVFTPESPIRIPGANVWLVVSVLTMVSCAYLWMMWLLWKISSEPEPEFPPGQAYRV